MIKFIPEIYLNNISQLINLIIYVNGSSKTLIKDINHIIYVSKCCIPGLLR